MTVFNKNEREYYEYGRKNFFTIGNCISSSQWLFIQYRGDFN